MLEFRLFLSSPRDVSREREIAKRLAAEVNEDPAYGSRCRLTVLAYEDCVPSQMGKPAQHVVDDFMRRAAEDTQLYQIITIDGGVLTYEARTATGELYDAFELRKRQGIVNELIEKGPEKVENKAAGGVP